MLNLKILVCLCACLLILPALCSPSDHDGVFSVTTQRNSDFQPNGARALQKARMKWGAPVAGEKLSQDNPDEDNGTVPALNQQYDKEYLSPMYIGTPGQLVFVDLDTGSADCWVFSSETQGPIGARNSFDPKSSSSAKYVNGSNWEVQYGDGSYAEGDVWLDSVELGGVVVSDVYIESAVHVSSSISIDPNLSGICGLCYDYPSDVYPTVEPFYRLLNATLKEPVFTADIYWQANGTYTFGAVDTSRNETDFTWLPLVPNASFWEFVHNGVNVGDTDVWLLSTWNGILDTGTSLILLDDAIVEYYYAAINGSKYDDTYGGWVFPCPEDLSTLPDLNLGFPDTSFVARIPGRFMLYEQMDPTYCYGGVQSSAGIGFDIFGDVFLKALVVVFDYGNGRIGLAPKPL